MNNPKKKSTWKFLPKINFKKPFNFVKQIAKSNKNINFMKHKFICLSAPVAIFLILVGAFIFNFCNNAYDFDAMIERTKTVISIPIKTAADSETLNKIQQITTSILNQNCSAQTVTSYTSNTSNPMENDFKNYILNKNGNYALKLTAIKSDDLTNQQKNSIFHELKTQFPSLLNINDIAKITSEQFSDTHINFNFWIQLTIVTSILIVCLLLYFGFKFKQLGFLATILVTLTNLILTLGTTFLIITLITKKINLVFLIGISLYFTGNLTILFNEIKKELHSNKNTINTYETANAAINKFRSRFLFTFLILTITNLCCFTFSLLYNNYLVFYFAISTSISIVVDILTNTLFNAQLWAILRNRKPKNKKPKNKKMNKKKATPLPAKA